MTFSNLASGGHTLEVEAVDLDSVASAPATDNWQVNMTAPDQPGHGVALRHVADVFSP